MEKNYEELKDSTTEVAEKLRELENQKIKLQS